MNNSNVNIFQDNEIDENYSSIHYIKSLNKKLELLNTERKKIKSKINLTKFLNIIKISNDCVNKHIKNIFITCDKNGWTVEYKYFTDKFTLNNYAIHSDSEDESDKNVREKKCTVKFGYNKRNNYYFLNQKSNKPRFKIYRNSSDILRITSLEYTYELDIPEHIELVDNYSKNEDVPEFLALKFFKYLIEQQLSNKEVLKCFIY